MKTPFITHSQFIMQKIGALLLSFTLSILLGPATEARRIDCTKFVFAPICRGVAAKRSSTVDNIDYSRTDPFGVQRLYASEMSGMGIPSEYEDENQHLPMDDEDDDDRRLTSEDLPYIRLATTLWPRWQNGHSPQQQSGVHSKRQSSDVRRRSRLQQNLAAYRNHQGQRLKSMLKRLFTKEM